MNYLLFSMSLNKTTCTNISQLYGKNNQKKSIMAEMLNTDENKAHIKKNVIYSNQGQNLGESLNSKIRK